MIFSTPRPFKEAVKYMADKKLLPSDASSAELMQLSPAIRERSIFSARVNNLNILQSIDDTIERVVNPGFITDPETGEQRPVQPGESMDRATAREILREAVLKTGYMPDETQRDGLQDLSSDKRLDLIIKMNTEMAQGYGNYMKTLDPISLDVWPAQELYRMEDRKVQRDWAGRWIDHGGQLYGGRMIALKTDPIWESISAFGLPYPPFDFNSGMWVRDISRGEAEDMGLLASGDSVLPPEALDMNEGLEMSVTDISEDLLASVMQSFGDTVELIDGVLRLKVL